MGSWQTGKIFYAQGKFPLFDQCVMTGQKSARDVGQTKTPDDILKIQQEVALWNG